MGHVVLLGDSIFDNAAYVGGGPDVVRQLGALLSEPWTAGLLAVDGSITTDVPRQLRALPPGATHLVVSTGGNDALQHIHLLNEPVRSTAEALERFARAAEAFEARYRSMLEAVLSRHLPTAVCTIYYPNFPDALVQGLAVTALSHFNDVILRQAFGAGIPVLDLRLICDDAGDYANPIEPSVQGGEKIARSIVRLLDEHDFSRHRTSVFARA